MTVTFAGRPLDEVRKILRHASPQEREVIAKGLEEKLTEWVPYHHQRIPERDWDWFIYLLSGGRGSGKTDGGAYYMNQHVLGPPCDKRVPGGHRVSIVAPTVADGIEACVTGPSGLQAHNPDVRLVTRKGVSYAIWPNGAEARLFGAHKPDDVNRLRAGGNKCLAWFEEWAAHPQLENAFDNLVFGLRLGPHPHIVASTTPKRRPLIVETMRNGADPNVKDLPRGKRVLLRYATIDDNPSISEEYRDQLKEMYAGTAIGDQELLGRLVDVNQQALWSRDNLERDRVMVAPDTRRCLGIDPSTWGPDVTTIVHTQAEGHGIETGMVATRIGPAPAGWSPPNGIGVSMKVPHLYVTHDLSGRMSPETWASKAVEWYHNDNGNAIIPEVNAGGGLVTSAIRQVTGGDSVVVKPVRAAQGKRARAEVVSLLSEQGRYHIVGNLPVLEEQLCSWDATQSWSPDRLDAAVWAGTWLLGTTGSRGKIARPTGTLGTHSTRLISS